MGARGEGAASRRRCTRWRRRSLRVSSPWVLPLAELEPGARAALAVLLALDDAGVARDEARLLQRRTELGLHGEQRLRDRVAHGARLPGEAAAADAGEDVVPVAGLGHVEGLLEHHLQRGAAEVLVHLALVHEDPPGAGREP